MLALVRHVAAVEKEEFRAEQAYAFGAAFQRTGHVPRQLDVGEQLDGDPVDGLRLGRLQPLELGVLQLDLVLA